MPNIYADRGKISLEKILQGFEAEEQGELTIEFLQELIRQALADFVSAQYPLLEYRRVQKLAQDVVSIRTPILSVDTLALADELMQLSGDRRAALKKEISARLISCAERALAGFLQFLERTAKGTATLTAEKILTDPKLDLEILNNYSEAQGLTSNSMNITELSSREIKVALEGKAWRIKLVGYSGGQVKPFSEKEKLLVALKKKQAFLQESIKPRLEHMAGVIKKQGPRSPLTMELKPFLKGAFDKTKFVEALARATFSRMAGTDISETSAQGLLQTLELEIQALERYLLKLERIFKKLEWANVAPEDLPPAKGMRLSAGDKALLSGQAPEGKELLAEWPEELQATRDLSRDDSAWFDPRHKHNGLDWSIKGKPKGPVLLAEAEARIIQKPIVARPEAKDAPKGGMFARLFGALLDPGKKFQPRERRVSATAGPSPASRSSREQPSVDVLLPAAPEGLMARNIKNRRGVYHHGFMF